MWWLLLYIIIYLPYMWPDLRKPGFHTHPILWLWQIITYRGNILKPCNFKMLLLQVIRIAPRNFSLLVYCEKLWSAKVKKRDVCGSLNPVTYWESSVDEKFTNFTNLEALVNIFLHFLSCTSISNERCPYSCDKMNYHPLSSFVQLFHLTL